jgi:hypothetical protein
MAIVKTNLFFHLAIFLIIGLPDIAFATGEATDLSYYCEKKLFSYSKSKLEQLKLEAEISVSNLPELKNLVFSILKDKNLISLNKKIVYSSTLIEESLSNSKGCFSEVSVFIDDPEKKHLWNTFLVNLIGIPKAIKNSDGNFITLEQWREETKSNEANCVH